MMGTEAVSGGLEEALRRGAVVVTANERAARTLRRGYDELLRSAGTDRWEPAVAMSWSAWTGMLWRRLLMEGRGRSLLLNPFQEHAVWLRVLGGDEAAGGLRGLDGLAEMAAETWGRMCAYAEPAGRRGARSRGFSGLLREDSGGTDTAAFARWARAFEERCEAERLLPMAELDVVLGEAVRSGELRLEEREIVLLGFDSLTPARARLVDALRSAGVDVSDVGARVHDGRAIRTAAADEAEELRACARWAAGWMAREPGARIAVIAPDVAGERPGMERVFREVLAPEMEAITAREGAAPFEFSLGRSLAETGMVDVALQLLRWTAGALPVDRVSALLVSEYFAGRKTELGARAEFDAFELRVARMLQPEIGLGDMARRLAVSGRARRFPGLLRAVRRLERAATGLPGSMRGYAEWAEVMGELLGGAGWGTEGAEGSLEFQARQRWNGALDAMSTLDFEGEAVEFGVALRALERIARNTVFAPESRSAPVQVMGAMEAAGSEFDAVWLLRAGEMSWPPAAQPLPLLRWGLQRDLKMPGTDSGRDLDAARTMSRRILASGREVVVSFAVHSGEARQRLSAVFGGLGLEEAPITEVAGAEPERTVIRTELMEDAAQVPPLPDGLVGGGMRVLELQAACGFRAFAEQRLWSSEMEQPVLGLDARESGTAIHEALESFWTEVRSQAALLAMSEEERVGAISRAVERGLEKAESAAAGPWETAYVDTQRQRLRRLLRGWLRKEMERPAFTVEQSEKELRDIQFGPLRLGLRIDRIDVVDGARVLIDYKTGAAAPADWMGERPDAPQVPLYAILAARPAEDAEVAEDNDRGTERAELGAVAFANVRAGKGAQMRGVAARADLLPERSAKMDAGSFAAQVDRWSEVLGKLAEEFAEGDARVLPKNYPMTCRRCGQRILCRLDAALLEEMEEEDEEQEGGDG